jgi:RNA-directed DNA polymerase
MYRTRRIGEYMQTSLRRIAKKARRDKEHRFRDLYGMLNEELLLDCWRYLNKGAASGVDRVTAREYERNLEGNVRELVERLKGKRYRARLVRRVYIPKSNGRKRPLGIPALEDKIVQLAAARILSAIYEEDFLPMSFGYRPKVGTGAAVRDVTDTLQWRKHSALKRYGIERPRITERCESQLKLSWT